MIAKCVALKIYEFLEPRQYKYDSITSKKIQFLKCFPFPSPIRRGKTRCNFKDAIFFSTAWSHSYIVLALVSEQNGTKYNFLKFLLHK